MNSDHLALSVDGVRVRFDSVGAKGAPAALLIHGWASSSRMWSSTIEHLQSRYRCVAIDLPGHGDSDKPDAGWYSMARFAHVVEEVARAADAHSPLILGHSMGGAVALHLAIHGTQKPRAMVLINPLMAGPVRPELQRWLYRPALAVGRRIWPVASNWLGRSDNGGADHAGGWRGRLQQHADLARTTADSAVGSMKAALACDFIDDLPRVACPTLMILGRQDRTIPAKRSALAAGRMPHAELVELNAGHLLFDGAHSEYLQALDRFLADEEAT